jgi:hypothetical protein
MRRTIATLMSALSLACARSPLEVVPPIYSGFMDNCPAMSICNDAELGSLRSCREINGDLVIQGVSTLEPLARLERVRGDLVISDTWRLHDLGGLERLRKVEGLRLLRNPDLADVSALNALASAHRVVIGGNPMLEHLDGLNGLAELDVLSIVQNGLYDVLGFRGLRRVGRLIVEWNLHLIGMGALDDVVGVEQTIVKNNPRLFARARSNRSYASRESSVF